MSASPLANPTATRQMLERFGLATKHRLGQNFLIDDNVIANILKLAALGAGSRVLEVGPGIGTLTLGMLPHAGSVVSIEADHELEPVLTDLSHEFANFAFVMGDALKVSWERVCEATAGALARAAAGEQPAEARESGAQPAEGGVEAACAEASDAGVPAEAEAEASVGVPAANDEAPAAGTTAPIAEPNILVANLPYNVAATIILKYLSEHASLAAEVVMVQAEVADRICADPGTKAYGAYTAKLRLYGTVTGRFEVPPTCFMPAPHVNSAVVRIERAPMADPATGKPLTPARIERVASVIDAAFAQRRKTIRNSMSSNGFEKGVLDAAFADAGIAPTARAEVLTPQEFIALEAALTAQEA